MGKNVITIKPYLIIGRTLTDTNQNYQISLIDTPSYLRKRKYRNTRQMLLIILSIIPHASTTHSANYLKN